MEDKTKFAWRDYLYLGEGEAADGANSIPPDEFVLADRYGRTIPLIVTNKRIMYFRNIPEDCMSETSIFLKHIVLTKSIKYKGDSDVGVGEYGANVVFGTTERVFRFESKSEQTRFLNAVAKHIPC